MASPTETYSGIGTTECQPNKPLTSELALRWRANLLAALQGAAGAQRLYLGALERLNAGDTQRALNETVFEMTATVYEDVWAFMVLQGGTVRLKWEQSASSAGDLDSYVRVLVTRAGVDAGYGEAEVSGTTYVAQSVDVSVQPGDIITFQLRRGGTVLQSVRIRNMIVATNGADLFPTEGLAGYINANTSLT